jgi:signal transduction histidine kinase
MTHNVRDSDLTIRQDQEKEYKSLIQELNIQKELREEFVSTLAHDLRTPLSAAKSYAELLIQFPERFSSSELAKRIIDTINRMDSMIRDLLDANRIQAGQLPPLHLEVCDLNALVRHTCEVLSTLFGNRFIIQTTEKICGFWNKDGIQRSLENLCNNAVKYGFPHTPITISLSRKEDWIYLSVHNQGQPIDTEEMPHLFRTYHRSSSALQGGKRGWGIGLTLVRGMAEHMGGRITVQSSVNEGTTFTMIIPIKRPSAPKAE